MAEHPPHTLISVREGLRAGLVVGEGRVEEGGALSLRGAYSTVEFHDFDSFRVDASTAYAVR